MVDFIGGAGRSLFAGPARVARSIVHGVRNAGLSLRGVRVLTGRRMKTRVSFCSKSTWLTGASQALSLALLVAAMGRTGLGADGPSSAQGIPGLSPADEKFLDELERASFRFFWEAADSQTGLVKDRSRADGADPRDVASIAATGFGLTALCIADERGFVPHDQPLERVRTTLRFLHDRLPNEHGFFYHFVRLRTGERVWQCELSSIDTAILLCGVLTCRQHFGGPEIQQLSRKIYERVDWAWMLNGTDTLSHGWKPETGFLKARWDAYCELMMLYLLALGSPTHPIAGECWDAWRRPKLTYEGLTFVYCAAPLFVHQYSHAWFDFRGQRDRYADYFQNSVLATKAHRLFCLNLRDRFPQFGTNLWGITASDSAEGYVAWGGPPEVGKLDGTLVPCATGGSLPFVLPECLAVLHTMRDRFGERVWKRYGFVDAFNPHTVWTAPDVIGIDVGITLVMAENARTGVIWNTFMKNPEVQEGMKRAGFRPGVGPR
jgi:hypothetical protein